MVAVVSTKLDTSLAFALLGTLEKYVIHVRIFLGFDVVIFSYIL